MAATLLTLFGLLALVLASIGVYGMVAYTVSRRGREVAIRMSLGARRQEVILLILRHYFTLGGVGVLCGLLGAVLSIRVMASLLLYVGSAAKLGVFLGMATVIWIVVIVASLLPALRASRLNPLSMLRD